MTSASIYLIIAPTEDLSSVLLHTPNACENTQTLCQWGQWKSEIFRWGPVQKHIMFSWKGSERESACLLSYHLTSVGRGELLTVVVFPVAEHADLWKQSLHTQTEAITLGELIEQDLAEQLCFGVLYLSSHSQICTVWGSPARAYEDWEWKPFLGKG